VPSNQINNEKIFLNSPEKPSETIEITTKTQKKRLWIIYGFLALCVIIIILLALRKL